MSRSRLMFVLAAVVALGALVSLPLRAQPTYPVSPTGKSGAKDLVVPPGIYNAFIFACEGSKGVGARATLKTPTGEMTIIVSAGETVIVPLQSWSLGQQGTIYLAENPGATLIVSAVTASGPIKLEPMKK